MKQETFHRKQTVPCVRLSVIPSGLKTYTKEVFLSDKQIGWFESTLAQI